ncbi:DUF6154 family protein [Anaerobacillus alkaliphilus]|nr:DUF6154 family protein [Anaerobacillus alkaliphilus]
MIHDVYKMYKDHLTGDEEDILVIVYGILDGFKNEDYLRLFQELHPDEKFEMTVLYLFEKLRLKIAQEGLGHIGNGDDQDDRILH